MVHYPDHVAPDARALIDQIKESLGALADGLESFRKVSENYASLIATTHERQSRESERNADAIAEHTTQAFVVERKKSAEQRKNLRVQWVVAVGTWTAVIAASVYAGFAYLQWRETISATNAAYRNVEEARRSRQDAEKSLRAAVDQFQLDERPWVTVPQFALSAEPQSGKEPPKITFQLFNSGKTPAINLHSLYETFSSPTPPPFEDLRTREPIPTGVLVPNVPGAFVTTEPVGSIVKTPGHLPAYDEGKNFIYIHITITYTDAFKKKPFWTSVCAYHSHQMPLNAFTLCTNGNNVGEEKDSAN